MTVNEFLEQQLKPYLRISHNFDDQLLTNLINSSISLVNADLDENNLPEDLLDNQLVQLAINMLVASQYANGTGGVNTLTNAKIPQDILNLIRSYHN